MFPLVLHVAPFITGEDCPSPFTNLMKKKDSFDGNVNISLYSETISYLLGENP